MHRGGGGGGSGGCGGGGTGEGGAGGGDAVGERDGCVGVVTKIGEFQVLNNHACATTNRLCGEALRHYQVQILVGPNTTKDCRLDWVCGFDGDLVAALGLAGGEVDVVPTVALPQSTGAARGAPELGERGVEQPETGSGEDSSHGAV